MIEKTLVPDTQRLKFLPGHFGKHHFRFEMLVFHFMHSFCGDYDGGYWNFYSLSNGGMFMALKTDETFRVVNPDNYCDEVLSAEASGIGVTLYGLNYLSFKSQDPRIVTLYHALRDFATEHAEARGIFAFID